MMTAMERSLPLYEERGSEASTADSLGIHWESKMQLRKAAKVRISNKGQLGQPISAA